MKLATNKYIATILFEIADILEMKNANIFKVRAYRRAAREVDSYPAKVSGIDSLEELQKIPGVGLSIAEKIKEIGETNTCEYYEQLKKSVPVDVTELNRIEGIGPKTIIQLYEKLEIDNVKKLEKAALKGKIRELEGFGRKSEENILKSIKTSRKHAGRYRLDEALAITHQVVEYVKKDANIKKVELAGSLRRKKETVGDADILALSKHPKKTMDFFVNFPEVERVLGKGKTKSTVELANGFQIDLRLVENKSFGAALQYFTGSPSHNVSLRKIAGNQGYKLNEYGLFDAENNRVAGKTEESVYEKLGLDTPPPELRTNSGEIEAAQQNKLPNLIKLADIRGDFQMHTNLSDGRNTITQMAKKAAKLGYEYIAITEHNTKGLEVAGGVDENEIPDYIRKIRDTKTSIKILAGLEVNIAKDGLLTVADKYLEQLDFVIVAIHSNFKMKKEEMTQRILKAFSNKHVNAFAHPTGRLLFKREGYDFDFEKVAKAAEENNVALEINSYPNRLDLSGKYIKTAKELGCKFTIGTDAHSTSQMEYLKYGVFMARRGWLEKKDVLNTLTHKELISSIKS